ncbi:hypothetical protein MASR2M78_05440 [Treponema sp.]
MISREDFIFTIGYDGSTAIVDGQAKRRYSSLSTQELAERGMFRAAYSSALRSGKNEEIDLVVSAYNACAHTNLTRESPLGRLFGVFNIDSKKAKVL